MGSFINSAMGAIGLNSPVDTTNTNPYQAINYWQTEAKGLNDQLKNQASGGAGINPAQQQYLQNAQGIQQQQANLYSQNRALNPGLAARLAGNTGANAQMHAASDAGIQQAQQQLAAQQLLGGLYSSQQQAQNQAGQINADIGKGNQSTHGTFIGGILNGLSAGGAHAATKAHGGMIEGNDHIQALSQIMYGNSSPAPLHANQGGKVPVLVSPGERYLNPQEAEQVASQQANPITAGEKIQGQAKVKGDSLKNDVVPKALDEGGVVIPRSVMMGENPEKEAAKFVAKALAEHGKSPEGEFRNALQRVVQGRKNK